MHVVAIIPARFGSTRFPGKALADATGKTLVEHVYQRARSASSIQHAFVATDDDRIEQAVLAFGGQCIRTRPDHPNGTSRIVEAIAMIDPEANVVVNVQGDEPEIESSLIDEAVAVLRSHEECDVATLASPIESVVEADDPNIVKVALDQRGRAMLFTRAKVPHARSGDPRRLKHIGLYVYRRSFLEKYDSLGPTPLEQAEQLEQLRILEHGFTIAVGVTQRSTPAGIDTPEQYEAFVHRWRTANT